MLDDVSYKANVDSDDNDTSLASVNIPYEIFSQHPISRHR